MPPRRKSDEKSPKRRILLVDDHPIVRERLTDLINQQADMEVCGEAADALRAMEAIAATVPDLAIVDLSMKGKPGIELIKDIRAVHRQLPVLVLSMHDESLYAERVLRAGARGYVTKQEATQNIMSAIRTVLAGQIYLSQQMTGKVLQGAAGSPLGTLSDRELEVFQLVGQGLSTRQIALRLHIDVKTVETYKAHLKQKLNIHDGASLVQYAIQSSQKDAGP